MWYLLEEASLVYHQEYQAELEGKTLACQHQPSKHLWTYTIDDKAQP